MSFINWFFRPIEEIVQEFKSIPQSVDLFPEVTSEKLDKSELKLNPELHKIAIFRPSTFQQYIGQERAKTILKDYISSIQERGEVMPHVLLSGEAGLGKTTLAKIIAKELGVNFTEIITSTLEDQYELLSKIEEVCGGILFLDEIHSIDRGLCESIYSIMEDFQYDGKEIKKFTLIGATTELGELEADRLPFVNRFKIPIELEEYTIEELSVMSRQFRLTVFPYDDIDFTLHRKIAENCRGNPRIAIRLTEALVYMKDIDKVFRNFGILKGGYTDKDLKVLKYVALNEKGVGLQGLASYLGTSAKNYLIRLEPWLLKNSLILRTPRGRKITELGLRKIEELEKRG